MLCSFNKNHKKIRYDLFYKPFTRLQPNKRLILITHFMFSRGHFAIQNFSFCRPLCLPNIFLITSHTIHLMYSCYNLLYYRRSYVIENNFKEWRTGIILSYYEWLFHNTCSQFIHTLCVYTYEHVKKQMFSKAPLKKPKIVHQVVFWKYFVTKLLWKFWRRRLSLYYISWQYYDLKIV